MEPTQVRVPKQQRTDALTLAALGVTIFFWSSAYAGIRVGLTAYTPGHLALLRFLVASAVLAGYAGLVRLRLPAGRDLPAIFGLGFMGITFHHAALNHGELTVTAGAASLLSAAEPVFIALLAAFFLRERLSIPGWAGIVVSFAGAALIALGEEGGDAVQPGRPAHSCCSLGHQCVLRLSKALP